MGDLGYREIDRRAKSMGLGGMDTKHTERNCDVDSCSSSPVTALGQQDLCLNHFLLHCYEQLERLDPRGRRFCSETLDAAAMRAFIEECSRKALDVSLHCENLSNLERGRLLDILLWAGELFLLLRVPRFTFAGSVAPVENAGSARAAAPRS
jgi:hypothetical protein